MVSKRKTDELTHTFAEVLESRKRESDDFNKRIKSNKNTLALRNSLRRWKITVLHTLYRRRIVQLESTIKQLKKSNEELKQRNVRSK